MSRLKMTNNYYRVYEDGSIAYHSDNGCVGRIYGKSSFSISYNGKEEIHTGRRSFNDIATLKKLTDKWPETYKTLTGEDWHAEN